MDSVFTREFCESDTPRNRYQIVHLTDRSSIEAAQRQTAWMAELATGIVSTRRGFAVRVAAAQYDKAVKLVYPNDSERPLGKR